VLPPSFDHPLRGVLLYVSQVACFFLISILVKTLATDFAVTELLLVRFSFTLLVLLIVIGPKRNFSFFRTRYPLDHLIRTVCGMIALGLTFVALSSAYIANATAVVLSAPIIATVLAIFILGERVSLSRMIAATVGFCGILLIVKPGFGSTNPAIYAALGAAVLFAFVIVWLRKLNRTEHPLCISFYYNVAGFAVFATWTLVAGLSAAWTQAPALLFLLLLLGIGFCGCLTTFSSWMLDVVKLLQAGQPVFGLLLIVVSLLLGVASAAAGFQLSRRVFNA